MPPPVGESLEGLADQASMASSIRILAEKVKAPVINLGRLLSEVSADYVASLREANGPKYETARRYKYITREFVALVGDKPVAAYRRSDLQHYVNEIAHLPFNATSRKTSTMPTSGASSPRTGRGAAGVSRASPSSTGG